MTNKRDLKAYVRYDGSGRVIAGSLVLRRKKPAVGNWHEIQGYECCNDVTLTYDVADAEILAVQLTLLCNGVEIGTYPASQDSGDMDELIVVLNNVFGMLGTFSKNSTEDAVILTMTLDQKKALCPEGTLTFTVTSGA